MVGAVCSTAQRSGRGGGVRGCVCARVCVSTESRVKYVLDGALTSSASQQPAATLPLLHMGDHSSPEHPGCPQPPATQRHVPPLTKPADAPLPKHTPAHPPSPPLSSSLTSVPYVSPHPLVVSLFTLGPVYVPTLLSPSLSSSWSLSLSLSRSRRPPRSLSRSFSPPGSTWGGAGA